MEELTWARIGLAVVVMAIASVSDWRSRTASDTHWYVMGMGGALLFGLRLWEEGAPWPYLACLALIALVFIDTLRDRPGMFEDGVNLSPLLLYALTAIGFGYLTVEHFGEGAYWALVTIPLLMLLFFILYQLDVIKGGADAKALMALSLVFPEYPVLEGLPLLELGEPAALTLMPFPLLVLFNAAILTLLMPLAFLVVNLARGDVRFPVMLFGTRMALEEAEQRHVWSMERVVDGAVRLVLFPRSDEEEGWDALREAGVERPWVTPKVPFLIPLTVAVPFSLLVGNPLLYLMGV